MNADEAWSTTGLVELFKTRLALDETRGVDRTTPSQLAKRIDTEAAVIARKVPEKTYRFAPYVELLRSKGRGKPPREICIPTARDRVVLLRLKELLHEAFPAHVGRVLPNGMVRNALKAVQNADRDREVCLRLDVKSFYDSIHHDRLFSILSAHIDDTTLELVRRAVRNGAVPKGSRRSHAPRARRQSGVPQGLAISNVLADIYLEDFDVRIREASSAYFRFVDDVLLIVEEAQAKHVYELVQELLSARGLDVHPLEPRSPKGGIFRVGERIEFLGYAFDDGDVTVRDASVDRFLENIAARVARYRRERIQLTRLHDWMTPDLARSVLIDELNERITGATSEGRRYGWMFYFSALTDERLLFAMDQAIESILARFPEVRGKGSHPIKRLARAFHEVRHRPNGRYVHNYDRFVTMKQRLDFLVGRGQLGRDDFVNEEQVNLLFERYRRQQLNELDSDLAFLS